jgi:bifunctional non-homologous end joining protein LigD
MDVLHAGGPSGHLLCVGRFGTTCTSRPRPDRSPPSPMAAKSEDAALREYRRKRDFSKTSEPPGRAGRRAGKKLVFVVQKHAASHLHYDLRLEIDGTMKSWAVPKGPSLDPSVKRLAMEVEDHPMEYNTFEGTIPKGEYGGGTVMLWDRGEFEPDDMKPGDDMDAAAMKGYRRGKLSFTMHGERLRGSFALVRTRGGASDKPQWLLIKHADEEARPDEDITSTVETSVATGRTMDEIAAGEGGSRVWRSDRQSSATPAPDPSSFEPMLAKSGETGRGEWVFEPKYDGIRVIAYATEDQVALISRNGRDKAKQFPELVEALRDLARDLDRPLVLDGEVVALDGDEIARFEALQGRMHLTGSKQIERLAHEQPAALVAFDLLLRGDEPLLNAPWRDRRAALEEVLGEHEPGTIRISETSEELEPLQARAHRAGWEGLIAKRPGSRYRPGKRSGDWLKLKMENQQELVVGGWTEPRNSRKHLGAILLGYYDSEGNFVYAGHTGGGFSHRALEDMYRRLKPLERKTSPFTERPRTNEKAHWTTPRVVVQIKFNEWTREGKLRQPTFLGVRDDKDPREVVREPVAHEEHAKERARPAASSARTRSKTRAKSRKPSKKAAGDAVARRLRKLRSTQRKGGTLTLPGGAKLSVSSLDKIFFPSTGHSKGDLLEYYAGMADYILPCMEDRPLVLKRYPNGMEDESFYQQAAPEEAPEGVRVEKVAIGDGAPQPRLVGGNLATLLYTVQLGAISYDPWHSRVQHLDSADYTVLDLDPGPSASFGDVVRVARWVEEEMEALGLHGGLKTSGSSGLHVYLPLPPGTPLEAATLAAQIVATRVARRDPKLATVKRMRRDRPDRAVYVDYLQNILGKTVAGVYAVRAKPGATVSTPLHWDELTDDLDMREFDIDTVPERVSRTGDLWPPALAEPNDLERMLERAR